MKIINKNTIIKNSSKSSNIFDIVFYTLLGLTFGIVLTFSLIYTTNPTFLKKFIETIDDNTGFGVYNDNLGILKTSLKNNFFSNTNNLPVMKIDIKFKHWNKINAKRNEALEKGILVSSTNDYIPAKIQVGSKKIKVKMRLKGDWTDHLLGEKWSFRIKTKDDSSLFGLRKFSIQNPKARGYHGQILINKIYEEYGLITPKYFFVKVIVNGKDIGIMAVEEHFSKELLERNKKKDGVIVKFDESIFWDSLVLNNLSTVTFDNYKNTLIDAFGKTKINRSAQGQKSYETAVGLMRAFTEKKLKPSSVFEIESLGRFLAITDFFGARHGTRWHNQRFYLNPLIMKFEPIPFDANMQRRGFDYKNMPIIQDMLSDEKVREIYIRTLEELNKRLKDGSLIKMLRKIEKVHLNTLHKEFYLLDSFPFNTLEIKKEEGLCSKFEQSNLPIYLHSNLIKDDKKDYLELSNAFCKDVLITSIQWINKDGKIKEFDSLLPISYPIVLPATSMLSLPKVVSVEHKYKENLKGYQLEIKAKIKGKNEERVHFAQKYYSSLQKHPFPSNTLNTLLNKHSFIKINTECEKCLFIEKGRWKVKGNIIVPKDYSLRVNENTNLQFEDNGTLIVKGTTYFEGSSNKPIILEGIENKSWAGVAIFNAKKRSFWSNVIVRNTKGINFDNWKLTGGVTFYKSDINLKESSFIGNLGEDALNIIHSSFKLTDVNISNTASDGFDGDFVNGEISGGIFSDIGLKGGGDGIDFSGSKISVKNTLFKSIDDKAISIGEKSEFYGTNITIENIGVGLASKDKSTATIENSTITKAKNFALMAYTKKKEYGSSNLIAKNVLIKETKSATRAQTGSHLSLNGKVIKEEDIDIKNLYKTIMKPGVKK